MCSTSNNVQSLGLHNSQGLNQESAFMDDKVADACTTKTLLKKIDRHRDSVIHTKSEKILKDCETDALREFLEVSQTLFEKRHKETIDVTAKVFRTAYECAKSQLSFSEHSHLMNCRVRMVFLVVTYRFQPCLCKYCMSSMLVVRCD